MINYVLLKKDSPAWSWLVSWINGWRDRWVDGQAGRWTDRYVGIHMYVWMNGWMDRWRDYSCLMFL